MIIDREMAVCGKGEDCLICNPLPPYKLNPTVTLRKHYETNLQRRGFKNVSLSQIVFTDNIGSCGILCVHIVVHRLRSQRNTKPLEHFILIEESTKKQYGIRYKNTFILHRNNSNNTDF